MAEAMPTLPRPPSRKEQQTTMKLRNKKTGEVIDAGCRTALNGNFWITRNGGGKPIYMNFYESLADLNEEWEDYEPKEPLIKDEKIRKAVRAWADANNITQVSHDAGWNAFRCTDFVIGFDYDFDRHDGLEDMGSYTIAELCGEEK